MSEAFVSAADWLQQQGWEKGHQKGRDEGRNEGRLEEARAALRRVLARRKLALSVQQEARIEACEELATLERWLDQAIDAKSTAEALR